MLSSFWDIAYCLEDYLDHYKCLCFIDFICLCVKVVINSGRNYNQKLIGSYHYGKASKAILKLNFLVKKIYRDAQFSVKLVFGI